MVQFLAFGSHYGKDDLAWEIAKSLKGVEVKLCSRAEDVLDAEGDIVILDVVKGLKCVRLLSVEDIEADKRVTAHDFDIGFFLKLMSGSGRLGSVRIIGIPEDEDRKKIRSDVERLIKSI